MKKPSDFGLARSSLSFTADWCVEAWYTGTGVWVLDQEIEDELGEPLYSVLTRHHNNQGEAIHVEYGRDLNVQEACKLALSVTVPTSVYEGGISYPDGSENYDEKDTYEQRRSR